MARATSARPCGSTNRSAPAASAASILSAMLPTSSTRPSSVTAPVPAIRRPFATSSGSSRSAIASVIIKPAEGPPTPSPVIVIADGGRSLPTRSRASPIARASASSNRTSCSWMNVASSTSPRTARRSITCASASTAAASADSMVASSSLIVVNR